MIYTCCCDGSRIERHDARRILDSSGGYCGGLSTEILRTARRLPTQNFTAAEPGFLIEWRS